MQVLGDFQVSVRRALSEIDSKWESYDGLIVCGTHTPHDVEQQIDEIAKARKDGTPALLICFGYQLGCIEFHRNVLGVSDATSEEFSDKGTFVVKKREQLKVGMSEGETWWSNFVADVWDVPDHFVATPFHPEYESAIDKPHPLLVKFLKLCNGNAK